MAHFGPLFQLYPIPENQMDLVMLEEGSRGCRLALAVVGAVPTTSHMVGDWLPALPFAGYLLRYSQFQFCSGMISILHRQLLS